MKYFHTNDINNTDSMSEALEERPEDFSTAADNWPLFRGKRIPVMVIRELPDDLMVHFNS